MLILLTLLSITLSLSQLIATHQNWVGLSLWGGWTTAARWGSYALASSFLLLGGLLWLNLVAPAQFWLALSLTPLAVALTLMAQLLGGSWVRPPTDPDTALTQPHHPAHGGCDRLSIPLPDGSSTPALFFRPPSTAPALPGRAVCLVHGAGDTKLSFKWRLIPALLAEGLSVLTLDLPGHGEAKSTPLTYPACLPVIPTAVQYLRRQQAMTAVAVYGISLGGAMTLHSLAESGDSLSVAALVIHATPTQLPASRQLFRREAWRTLRSPVLSIFRQTNLRHLRRTWLAGGYRSSHRTAWWIDRLAPAESLARLAPRPTLLIYSPYDSVAGPAHAIKMQTAAPHAELLTTPPGSHVSLLLLPSVVTAAAGWLRETLSNTSPR